MNEIKQGDEGQITCRKFIWRGLEAQNEVD